MVRNSRRARLLNNDPSPDEIRQRTEDIRRNWTPHELDRRCNYKPIAWHPPVFSAAEVPQAAFDVDVNPYG